MSKNATRCRACEEQRSRERHEEAARIVATGKCPNCGAGLVRNLALAGWWQCGAHGEPSFRRPEYRELPPCDFQTFTQ
jgi:hypothetical protein